MLNSTDTKLGELATFGYTIIENVFTDKEVEALIYAITAADQSNPLFRKTKDLFAIRQFLKELPAVSKLVFNERLKEIIGQLFGNSYFVVKSIYFDKPPQSNWFVACHQDLTISVKERTDTLGFGPWTVKQGQFAVQPPLNILEDNFTVRVHLDDTDEGNGALKVVQGSHLKGIYRPETVDRSVEQEVSCSVKKGGIMIMRPLLLHASSRTKNEERRRVIHIEFSRKDLPKGMEWAERQAIVG
jgi:ectoine hydroxylase-related dioxygenase (phytanoyl-CoA dioxygenase family)